jgi:hypothetical protein
MESSRSDVWNHGKAVYGIKPQGNARYRVMPYRRKATDSIHRTSCGNSMPSLAAWIKKSTSFSSSIFFGAGKRT